MSPWILLILGLVLIFIEFYLPGTVLGIAGGISLFASIVIFTMQSDSIVEVIGYIILVIIAFGVVLRIALRTIRDARPDRSIYSNDAQDGFQASEYDHSAIGKSGIAVTDLKPGGYVLVEGKRMQAISQAGYITSGSPIIVVSGQEESLIVKQGSL